MAEHPDVIVLGGGVIGLTAAYYLAREGLRVEVVERGDPGQESSWAGAGILSAPAARPQTPLDHLLAHSRELLTALADDLRESTHLDPGHVACGGFALSDDDADAEAAHWQTSGIEFEEMDAAELADFEPALAAGSHRVFFLPAVAQLRNPRHLKALIAWCGLNDVRLRTSCQARGFEREGRRVTAVQTDAGPLSAGQFLVAAGAWADDLLGALGWRPGVRPVRGQIALLNTGVPILSRVVELGKRYLVPRPDGRILVGSTEEEAGYEKRTTAAGIGGLLALAQTLAPRLASAQLERCWAGLRPGSPDGLPFLGAVPGCDNLFVAAGHYRGGIQLSAGTGSVLTDLLLGRPPAVPLEAFAPDRATR
jgi:glycine oxidase